MENKKTKICCVANNDIAVKFLLIPQLKFLMEKGYDVYVVCSSGKWIKDIEDQGIKVKTIKIIRKITPFSDLLVLIKLFFYFKKEKFDIVHTHNPKPGLLGQLAAKLAGVPVIINTIHGLYFNEKSSALKRKFFIIIEKIEARCSDLIFSQNKEDMETLVKERISDLSKIKYLGNGVDIKKFNPERFTKDYILKKKNELKIDPDFNVIGTVGRLVKEKGYLDLFKALEIVLKKMPETLILAIGPKEPEKRDGFKPSLAKEYGVEKNVIFIGERTDVDELYALMDVFVLASHREGFPRTVIEAMAMQRPIIATNIRGCREEIDNGRNGILIPPKNPAELAEEIIFLLENKQKADQMAKEARAKAEKEFDESLVFGRIKESYEILAKERLNGIKNKRIQLFIKRIFDLVFALFGLILLSPLFLIIAILIKLDSPGPVFFKYERAGKYGKPFCPYKFRTMVQGAIKKGLGHTVAKDDERITNIGRFLRKWAIDEFPQLINVLKGEMSVVGPRPMLKEQADRYNNFEKKRLLVKPGLAGWALIHGRNLPSWDERIKYDVWYAENWSLWLDIKIILKTFYLIFIKQEGVYGKDGINDPFI